MRFELTTLTLATSPQEPAVQPDQNGQPGTTADTDQTSAEVDPQSESTDSDS
jgi:hypothetical protein